MWNAELAKIRQAERLAEARQNELARMAKERRRTTERRTLSRRVTR